jgi:hypothetical protein
VEESHVIIFGGDQSWVGIGTTLLAIAFAKSCASGLNTRPRSRSSAVQQSCFRFYETYSYASHEKSEVVMKIPLFVCWPYNAPANFESLDDPQSPTTASPGRR